MKICLVGAALALILVPPAVGDWLVLHDGTRIETAGPWKLKGRQVVYTAKSGALSALRLADVDLEASQAASNERPAPAEEEKVPPARRQSVLVLTNDDIKPAQDPVSAAEVDEAATDGAEDAQETGENIGPVELITWASRDSTEVEGLEIFGTIRNLGEDVATAIVVQVSVSDENGEPKLDARAFLQRASLAPGQSGNFRALLPGVYTLFGDPSFRLTSDQFSIQGPERSEDDGEASETVTSPGGE